MIDWFDIKAPVTLKSGWGAKLWVKGKGKRTSQDNWLYCNYMQPLTTSDDEQYCTDNRYHYHSQSLLFAVYYHILLISIIIIATQCNDIHCINTLVRQSLPSYSFHPRNLSKVLSACCPCREYDLICSRKENRIWIIIFCIY